MKTKAIHFVLMSMSVLLAQRAAAQEPRWTVNVGGGFTNPVRGIESRLDRGWNFSAGAGPRFTRNLSLVGEFNYNELDLSRAALTALSMPDGNTRVWSITANPRVNFNPDGILDFYLIGGGGVYRRTVEFTQPTVTTITVFDPWWGIVYPAAVPANQILASYSTTRGGLNIGGGITVRLGHTGMKLYGEARYHHMFTPGVATTYLPVTFGLQW
ncbi:MAG TPA: outer membrane beta-barrel protein [Bryobacteraceae bacterium]|nr:outer membrane beta-barrel protein [Bryobacteraceae bacterium]